MSLSSKKISGQRPRHRNRNGEKLNSNDIPSSAQKKAIRDAFLREQENGPMKRWDQDGSSQCNLLADDNEDMYDVASRGDNDFSDEDDDHASAIKFGNDDGKLNSNQKPNDYKPGQRVNVPNFGDGVVHFLGLHQIDGKPRAGVVLDLPVGMNNGTVNGHKYFVCKEKYGVLLDPRLLLPPIRATAAIFIPAKLEDADRVAHFYPNGSTQRRVSWVSSPLLCIGICLLFKTRKYHHQINFIC